MKILVLNDSIVLNKIYRSSFYKLLKDDGYVLHFFTLKPLSFLIFFFRSFSNMIISSNIRSNLICMLMPWSFGLIIINGLGRYSKNPYFRILIFILIKLNHRKFFIIQNYKFYRFCCRFLPVDRKESLFFICGSGGYKLRKSIASLEGDFCAISRDSKFKLVRESLVEFSKIATTPINVIGVSSEFSEEDLNCSGRRDFKDVLTGCNFFIHPSGYGEGFPHALSHALCSELTCFIEKKDFIEFGLYRELIFEKMQGGWVRIPPSKSFSKKINHSNIAKKYRDVFICMIDLKI
jgi:hypothetical protein